MPDSLVKMERVTRAFELHGQRIEVLRGVDLEVNPRDSVVIDGSSGAGKSTLLSILGLIDLDYGGHYRFHGEDAAAASANERSAWRLRRVGMAFQDLWLVESLTALENLLVPLLAARVDPEAAHARARELLEAAGLTHALQHRPSELSGGERRRVAVARALVNRPGLLLVDEPTAELDSESARRVLDLLRKAQDEGAALVAASHDPAVLGLAQRRLRLERGVLRDAA